MRAIETSALGSVFQDPLAAAFVGEKLCALAAEYEVLPTLSA